MGHSNMESIHRTGDRTVRNLNSSLEAFCCEISVDLNRHLTAAALIKLNLIGSFYFSGGNQSNSTSTSPPTPHGFTTSSLKLARGIYHDSGKTLRQCMASGGSSEHSKKELSGSKLPYNWQADF